MSWVLVGLGGAIGAVARHALNGAVQRGLLFPAFPYGIFLVNVLGSAALGLLVGLATSRVSLSDDARVFIVVGLLGGFTTFSSFTVDTLTLLRAGHSGLALLNVLGQVGLSLIAAAIGYRIGS